MKEIINDSFNKFTSDIQPLEEQNAQFGKISTEEIPTINDRISQLENQIQLTISENKALKQENNNLKMAIKECIQQIDDIREDANQPKAIIDKTYHKLAENFQGLQEQCQQAFEMTARE